MKHPEFRILIADDDLDDQDLMKEALGKCQVKVVVDSLMDGVQVMDYLLGKGQFKGSPALPNLIFLDLNMPLMDGIAVLKEVKRYPQLQLIPIFVITTSRSAAHRRQALELGASGFYSKGSSAKEIIAIMQDVCSDCFASG